MFRRFLVNTHSSYIFVLSYHAQPTACHQQEWILRSSRRKARGVLEKQVYRPRIEQVILTSFHIMVLAQGYMEGVPMLRCQCICYAAPQLTSAISSIAPILSILDFATTTAGYPRNAWTSLSTVIYTRLRLYSSLLKSHLHAPFPILCHAPNIASLGSIRTDYTGVVSLCA
ncbi:hypothetical protein K439DRAFT_1078028 [Ramaria rubella]|nr:hypothetical protein K439DRAFT_1078028 [Ramaria rubella]